MKPDALSDPELEQALLASLLSDNGGLDRLGQLEPDDLADPIHAAALSAMLDLKEEGRAVTLVSLRSRFAAVPLGDNGSMLEYLKRLEFAGKAADVGDIAAALRELSQRREIMALGERIASSVHDQAVGPGRLLTNAARSVDDLLAKCRPAGKTLWSMPEAIEDLLSASDDKDLCFPSLLEQGASRLVSGGPGWQAEREGAACLRAWRENALRFASADRGKFGPAAGGHRVRYAAHGRAVRAGWQTAQPGDHRSHRLCCTDGPLQGQQGP